MRIYLALYNTSTGRVAQTSIHINVESHLYAFWELLCIYQLICEHLLNLQFSDLFATTQCPRKNH